MLLCTKSEHSLSSITRATLCDEFTEQDDYRDSDFVSVNSLDDAFNNVTCIVYHLALDETPRHFASFIYILEDAGERLAF